MNPSPPLPVSVCIVSGNEAARIRRTLESVAGWVGEMIVATDPGVTDGTEEIAVACGARIVRGPWKDHATHRNLAAANATQPWLLALDADEVVSPALRDEIIQTITAAQSRPKTACAAYSFPRCTFFCGRWIRHGDWYPDRVLRLWRRELGRWEGITHEKLVIQGRVGKLNHDLLHYIAETINDQIRKTAAFSDHFVQQCAAQGKHAGWGDMLVRPWWRFVRCYVLRCGFLDGWQGCYIAWMTAFYTATRYAKLRAVQPQKKGSR
jgi:glycosyltransferase involved in cell wall biosynthesis